MKWSKCFKYTLRNTCGIDRIGIVNKYGKFIPPPMRATRSFSRTRLFSRFALSSAETGFQEEKTSNSLLEIVTQKWHSRTSQLYITKNHIKARIVMIATTYKRSLFRNRDFEELPLVSSNAGRSRPSYIVSSDQPVFSSEPHSGHDNDFIGTSAPQFGQIK